LNYVAGVKGEKISRLSRCGVESAKHKRHGLDRLWGRFR
jgi:hypothetical protein